jgi:anaerobic selenocysteine-containing dehydrogenase
VRALAVTVEGGRVTAVAGDRTHPFTAGVICGKVHDYAERLYAPTRVLTPLRRIGGKGEGRFAPMGWDEAIALIAARWRAVADEWGGE